MVLGPAMAGKSAAIYTAAKAMSLMHPERKYVVIKMNPKAMSIS